MYRYYRFQVEKFIRASLGWESRIQNMRTLLEDNPLNIMAYQELLIISNYQRIFEYERSLLDDMEKEVLEVPKHSQIAGKRLKDVAIKFNENPHKVYTIREKLIADMQKRLEKNYSMTLLSAFYDIDLRGFFKDSWEWDKEIRKLQNDMASLLDLKSTSRDGTGISSTTTSDVTGQVATRITELSDEIERLESYKEILRWIISILTQAEYDVICAYYGQLCGVKRESEMLNYKKEQKGFREDRLCEKYFYSEGTADRKKNLVEQKIKTEIFNSVLRPQF